MRGPNPNIQTPLSQEEMRLFQESQAVAQLRDSVAFRKIYEVIRVAVLQAQNDLEVNTNPHADAFYKLIWQSRKHLLTQIDEYIENTINKRRDAVGEFLRSFGVNEDLIAKNLDSPLDFLMPGMGNSIGGPNGNTTY